MKGSSLEYLKVFQSICVKQDVSKYQWWKMFDFGTEVPLFLPYTLIPDYSLTH